MQATTKCPTIDDLQRLALGTLTDADAEPLESHLLECPECIGRLASLHTDDTFLEALRSQSTAKADPSELSDEFRNLVSRMAELSLPTLSSQIDATSELMAGDVPSDKGQAVETSYSFLAPARETGELGWLGGYRVLRVLGAGGMGVVFEAEDVQLKRRVALKVMKPELAANTAARQRFLREAQTVAALDHDHVVAIFQVGEDRGVPFLAMPFLQGESLDERLKRDGKLPIKEVLRIGREVADGLAAAHVRGLIHRDIKPGNIWLEAGRSRPRAKILDFGLARANEGDANLTHSGAILGTPAYMAPEQARGETIDARADLFSLGCVLYRASTGQPPFRGKEPLAVLTALAISTPTSPCQVNPEVPTELSELVMQLLAKDADGRPATALEVVARTGKLEESRRAGDEEKNGQSVGSGDRGGTVNRKLAEDEVQALPAPETSSPTAAPQSLARSRYGKWPPRRSIAVALAATATTALLAGIVIIVRDSSGKKVVEIETENGAKVNPANGAIVEIRPTTPGPENDETAHDDSTTPPDQGTDAPSDEPDPQPIQNPKSKIQNCLVETTAPLSNMALVTRPAKIPNADSFTIETIGHRGPIYQAEYDPVGQVLATLGTDGTLRLWNATTGTLLKGLVGTGPEGCFCWSFDGTQLAVCDREAITLWELATGKRLRAAKIDEARRVWNVAWSPDGRTLATIVTRRDPTMFEIELYDAESGELLDTHCPNWAWNVNLIPVGRCLAWSPDSGKLAITNGGAVLIWNVSANQPASTFVPTPPCQISGISWNINARLLAAVDSSRDNSNHIELWDAEANELFRRLTPTPLRVDDMMWIRGFSAGGKTLVVSHHSDSALTGVSTWNVAAGTVIRKWQLQEPRPNDTRFAAAAGDDPQVAEFSAATGELRTLPGAVDEEAWRQTALQPGALDDNTIGLAAWAPDGSTLAGESMGCAWFWNIGAGRARAVSVPLGSNLASLAWSAGDVRACLKTGECVEFDSVTAAIQRGAQLGPLTGPVVLSPDGSHLAVADAEEVRIFATDTAKLLHSLTIKAKYPPVWSHDGKLLATVADETTLWDVATGKPLHTLPIVGRCEWSPDGSRLAYTIGNGELLEIRDTKEGELVTTLENDEPVVVDGQRLAWSHDGQRIAGFGRIWDASNDKVVHQLERSNRAPNSISPLWSPDDQFVTYPTPYGSTAIADAATGQVSMTLLAFSRNRSLAVSAEGHYRASPRTDEELIYIVETEAGQETLSPREFEEKYGWKNDTTQVGLGTAEHGARYAEREHANVGVGIEQAEGPIRNPQSEIRNRSMSPLALVQHPKTLPKQSDVLSWSIEPLAPIALHRIEYGMLALRPDGKLLAIAYVDGHIRVFDCDSGKLVKLLIGHASPVECVDWSRDGRLISSADRDTGQVCVWDAVMGRMVSQAQVGMKVTCLQWSPDGRALAAGGDGDVRFVEPNSGELLPSVKPTGYVGSLSWSPDSKRLAGGGGVFGSAGARIWNVASGELEHTLACPSGMGSHVAWSPDGKSLALVPSVGDEISVWNTIDGTLRRTFDVPALYFPSPVWLDEGTTITGLYFIRESGGCKRLNVETGTLDDDPWLKYKPQPALCFAANRLVAASCDSYGSPVEVYDSVSRKRRSIEINNSGREFR